MEKKDYKEMRKRVDAYEQAEEKIKTISQKNEEYFKEVAAFVHDKRSKSNYSVEELRAYEKGRADGVRSVLIEMGEKTTYGQLLKRYERACKFLEKEKHSGRLATQEIDTEIWQKHLGFEYRELLEFAMLNIHDYRARLKKAREAYANLSKLLTSLQQMTID